MRALSFERRVYLDALLVAAPAIALLAAWAWWGMPQSEAAWTLGSLAALLTLGLASRLRNRVVFPLYTLSNLLEALREGDYSLRGSRARHDDAIGEVVREVNALSQTLRDQRLRVQEASALLTKVIEAIDIALFSFDADRTLRLINPAGERLLAARREQVLGRTAQELGIEDCLAVEGSAVMRRPFPGGTGSFEVRRKRFRDSGLPHDLLVITDLSRALREEERQAWQRLIRVLGHELNNSLAPIKSMAATLAGVLAQKPPPEDWTDDLRDGLKVIGDRAEALSRFMIGYATLARLPPPSKSQIELAALLEHVSALEQRVAVQVVRGPDVRFSVDPDQLEQALINLIKNATEASLPQGGDVAVRWQADRAWVRIEVVDEGLGLGNTENLFVPFFTTKPGGTGIGLVLARQIAEGHGGTLVLVNRDDRSGCIARVELPRN
ncbi:MAG TPA: ATP-binding protein [Xanthomonadaceae bacterium]|nr:ATP-binding protein [Xanthomonadaceae bacterium]